MLVETHEVMIRPLDFVPGYRVADGQVAQVLASALGDGGPAHGRRHEPGHQDRSDRGGGGYRNSRHPPHRPSNRFGPSADRPPALRRRFQMGASRRPTAGPSSSSHSKARSIKPMHRGPTCVRSRWTCENRPRRSQSGSTRHRARARRASAQRRTRDKSSGRRSRRWCRLPARSSRRDQLRAGRERHVEIGRHG